MASKLCCTAEHEDRPESPELPNARFSQATPAKRPLLPQQLPPPSSRFTNVQSEDLYELRDIFNNVQDHADDKASMMRPSRARFSRGSMHSLRSLHKMTSMRSILRRKFSKDSSNKELPFPIRSKGKNKATSVELGTVVQQPRENSNQQLHIIKHDLRKDLLSDDKPDESGYDSDAKILGDIAQDIGKKSPGKRPSIHSIEWAPPTCRRPTPGSSTKGRNTPNPPRDIPPYNIRKPQKPQTVSFSTRFTQVFSTPDLRLDTSGERKRRLRRSHSATSMTLPKPSPISPLRLPSLTTHDDDGIPWSEVMKDSLRLSQSSVLPRQINPKTPKTMSDNTHNWEDNTHHDKSQDEVIATLSDQASDDHTGLAAHAVRSHFPQLFHITSPMASTSEGGVFKENSLPLKRSQIEDSRKDIEDNDPRHSVHLHTMRISHHLRSGSLLSWEQLADAPELPTSPRSIPKRTISEQSRQTYEQRHLPRHERHTSSSGFASSKLPSRWGKIIPNQGDPRADVASSIYSSRPQSPPESSGGSMVNFSGLAAGHHTFSISSMDFEKCRRSNSLTTDNEDTPRLVQRYGIQNALDVQASSPESPQLARPFPLSRKNSVADPKTSKFREELSPSPPKQAMSSSTSIMKFFNSKRLSMRSQSETNLQSDSPAMAMDGLFDTLPLPTARERRQSRSILSLQTEQGALWKDKAANHVWDRALKAHQEEKASLFLPRNRDLAVHGSPFRERSGSTAAMRTSVGDLVATDTVATIPKRSSAPLFGPHSPVSPRSEYPPTVTLRRSALAGKGSVSPGREVSDAFEKQGDSIEVVGAWGRYPSHTRHDRTFSASKLDHVETRDFALEAAIRIPSAREDTHEDDLIDPTDRLPSPPLLPGEKKRKRKIGSGHMAKSNSMTFGKTFFKNYSKIFKSQSIEFRRHGRGHRSSITSGGILEFPELELLPDVWPAIMEDDRQAKWHNRGAEHVTEYDKHKSSDVKGKAKMRGGDSMATLYQRHHSSAPSLDNLPIRDNANATEHSEDCARVWSTYYETCVPSFPCQSAGEDIGRRPRPSFDSKQASLYSHTLPARSPRHSRIASQLSHITIGSRGSARPSFLSMVEVGDVGEETSLVSVRRSTMDLISKFKEQETTGHERVIALTWAVSRGSEERATSL
ncbi:hypothetical protein BKA66DRAFT_538217 [Pyrenochaeta sp. MPI-SDFR-AT-0127]|nr:hypothetical protein BKA66DRAFT_538217 [Pyrenochaeta sp. MPI-SDFR-AT-0127]